jgi:hypothetical protein
MMRAIREKEGQVERQLRCSPLPADRFPLGAPDVGTELALSKGND